MGLGVEHPVAEDRLVDKWIGALHLNAVTARSPKATRGTCAGTNSV